ncbi:MgtC/SapB family protein [Nostoc ellipsosporum NOK]|jgi:putative Mg2+ transporter-C (MgtC) family protein|nr:MgtC/SapB family protein [Nostoc ellipsosporum NOK]
MLDHWEILDLYKALSAVAAGVILGLERELKDKAAGLKTITVICLGSALFAIISYKIGGADGESTRIASYIVSGVGFLGAGVIFKDGINVSGLTTAGIIWLAAAVGTALGFGEFFLAITFVGAALIIMYLSPHINRVFRPRKQTRSLSFSLHARDYSRRAAILQTIREQGVRLEEKKVEFKNDTITISMEAIVRIKKLPLLEAYLVNNPAILSFSL